MNALVEGYGAAIKSMEGGTPRVLQSFADFSARQFGYFDTDLSLQALSNHLSRAGGDDPLRRRLHLAVAGWDAATTGPWCVGTTPHSIDRRRLVYRLLGLDEVTESVMDDAFPRADDGTVVISDEFDPWYTEERRTAHDFYWRAYQRHLLGNGWDPEAVGALDTATSAVVERLSDPTREQAYQAKGLVVGYVQSGKTANFTGVAAKAIDAGYRLVIVLTGTVDILRRQTQRRLDMELVGVENIFLGVDPENVELAKDIDYYLDEDLLHKFLRHGFQPAERGLPNIVRLTRHGSDYRSLNGGITALELEKRHRQKPLYDPDNLYVCDARLAVVKKNAAVLRRLVRDLKIIRTSLGQIPTLIIDDESDQASVNTSDPQKWAQGRTRRTAINELISELLGLLPRAQYVGYTATPYANVFVDPGDSEDIFPKDFLLSLDRPTGYMGVTDFHDIDSALDADEKTMQNSNEKAYVRDLVAAGPGAQTDAELLQALDAFLLTGALKLYREQADPTFRFKHHTMLVHESVRTAEHRDLAAAVRRVWNSAGYMLPIGSERLSQLLADDFRPVHDARAPDLPFPGSWAEVNPHVGEALRRITSGGGNPVLVVNSDKDIDQEDLDFQTRPVWRVLVGGAKLSRGFTLEGLTVSYYRRTVRSADSLMQMGRWFGFRRGYQDLVRLFIQRAAAGVRGMDLYKAFEAVVRDEESFRGQLRRYAKIIDGRPQLTPRDIPPLVSQHLPTITPSARNKMFNAELVVRRSPGELVEPTAYPKDADHKRSNYGAMQPLLRAADTLTTLTFPAQQNSRGGWRSGGSFQAYVGTVDAGVLLTALTGLVWLRPGYFRPDLAYLGEITDDEAVHDWAVILPQLHTAPIELPGIGPRNLFERQRRTRAEGVAVDLFGALSDPKHRPAAVRIAGARPSWADPAVDALVRPRRGAIILYPVVEQPTTAPQPDQIVIALSLYAPADALTRSGQVVQFRPRDSSTPKAPIVSKG